MIHLVTGSAGMKHDALGQGLHYHYTCLNQSQRPPILYTCAHCTVIVQIIVQQCIVINKDCRKRIENHTDTSDFPYKRSHHIPY